MVIKDKFEELKGATEEFLDVYYGLVEASKSIMSDVEQKGGVSSEAIEQLESALSMISDS